MTMTASRKALLTKIRKCLALAASANEHEAAAALSKARALMDEHGIDSDDPALADVGMSAGRGSMAIKPTVWEGGLASLIRRTFDTQLIYACDRGWIFIGVGASPEIASYAFGVLFRQLKRARREYIGRHLRRCKLATKTRRADIFCEGWVSAAGDKVRALKPTAVDNAAIGKFIEQAFPRTGTLTTRSNGAKLSEAQWRDYERGQSLGRDASLHAGVATDRKQLSLA